MDTKAPESHSASSLENLQTCPPSSPVVGTRFFAENEAMSEKNLSGKMTLDPTRDAWLALANAAKALETIARLYAGQDVSFPDSHAPILPSTDPHAGKGAASSSIHVLGSLTVAEAVNEFLVTKARTKSERYVRTLRNSLSKFARGRAHAPLSTITTEQLERWLADSGWAAGTQEGYLSDVSILYNFARRRGWVAHNPASNVELPDVEEGAVAVHTPEQVRAVMETAREYDLDVCRCMALRYFAGLRAIEAESQSESDIFVLESTLKVTRAKRRTRARRPVSIVPALNAWLGVGGRLPLANAGQKMAELARRVTAKGVAWPQNAPRHSFCSYHLALHENAALTARQAGHSETILFARYNGEVTKKAALEYFQVLPSSIE